jgi:hypothetical protein
VYWFDPPSFKIININAPKLGENWFGNLSQVAFLVDAAVQ